MEERMREFEHALMSMDRAQLELIAQEGVNTLSPVGFVESIVAPVLERIGEGWENGTVSLSQVYMSGRICEELISEILPTGISNSRDCPLTAIAVLEDYHMLGKRMVYSVLRANGFDPIDYGRVTVEEIVRSVERDRAEVLLISTLMLPSALKVRDVVHFLNKENQHPKIIVGGAPFRLDAELFREVGAHGTADKASDVVKAIRKVTENGHEKSIHDPF